MTVKELIPKHDGTRFQEKLAKFIIDKGLRVVVETGMGVSSIHILDQMDNTNIDYQLFSIDPAAWFPDRFEHSKHTLIEKKSVDAMLDLYYQHGPWDLFLHDGAHEILEQTYEYNFAFDCLKPGGYLVSDDINWNNNNAWTNFINEKGLNEFTIGDCHVVQKPLDKAFCPSSEAKQRHETYLSAATKLEEEWLAAGGVKHPAFA